MNRERAKELLPIIQAFSDGKDIEWRHPIDNVWRVCPYPGFDGADEYRIKPQPREFWINSDGVGLPTAHCSLDEAIGWTQTEGRIIKVREVLE